MTIIPGYCECGCGQRTEIRRYSSSGKRRGEYAKFSSGHGTRFRDWPIAILAAPAGLDPSLGDCWMWRLGKDKDGYGKVNVGGRSLRAHTYLYMTYCGPISEGQVPDHLCRRPGCVNFWHLEQVPGAVNTQRGKNAKLTPAQVVEIFVAPQSPRVAKDFAAQFNVGRRTVLAIRQGLTWRNITTGLRRLERQDRPCRICGAIIPARLKQRICDRAQCRRARNQFAA